MVEPENALLHNISAKGEASYYYAHAPRKVDNIEGAIVLGGEGIVTGGPPQLLARQDSKTLVPVTVQIRNYSWTDDGALVTIYIPLVKEIVADAVSIEFSAQALQLNIVYDDELSHSLSLRKLAHPVNQAECTWRVRTNKLVLKLKKTDDLTKWYSLVAS
jgi:hypothetical protein